MGQLNDCSRCELEGDCHVCKIGIDFFPVKLIPDHFTERDLLDYHMPYIPYPSTLIAQAMAAGLRQEANRLFDISPVAPHGFIGPDNVNS